MKRLITSLLLISSFVASAISLEIVSDGYKRPVDIAAIPENDDVLFVVEQHGAIHAIDRKSGKKMIQVFDISDRITRKHNEQGLLGLAVSPTFKTDGRIYVNYTDKGKPTMTHVSRFVIDPTTFQGDPSKEEKIYSFKQDFGNHNGGWISFGPDSYLYISAGDGGAGNDPKARAQDLTNPLGSILRIDVSGEKGYTIPKDNPFVNRINALPEIYSYGLRNAWRNSFDQKTGDFWIADVGQGSWEEINFMKPGEAAGKNFGWRLREGLHKTPKKGVGGRKPKGAIDPIYEYRHNSKSNGGLSITGGYVYRGPIKSLNGHYFFADLTNPRIWSIREKNGKATNFTDHTNALLSPKGKPILQISSDSHLKKRRSPSSAFF